MIKSFKKTLSKIFKKTLSNPFSKIFSKINFHFIIAFLCIAFFTQANFAQPKKVQSLNELLKLVQQDQIEQVPELKQRELKFLKARNKQRSLLRKAKAELKREEAILKTLQTQFEKQEVELSGLESRLALVIGTLGELFGVVRQTSRNLKHQLDNSIISTEYKNRSNFLDRIAKQKKLPNTKELEQLWALMHQEITESGKVTRFNSKVTKSNGNQEMRTIVRVGSFNLVSQKEYLNYETETNKITEFPKKVGARYVSLIDNLEDAKTGYKAFGLDPARGALLSLFMQSPNLLDRVHQGGLVGYVIILLLLFALSFSVLRFLKLRELSSKIKEQMASSNILKDNPLGDIKQTFQTYQHKDIEVLELKLEEVISKKTSQVQKGLSTIKVLASIAPLLGLLGTVTGMIATFQSITLFGTGDPKLMAGGISQALITTVLGLIAAIPLILIYNYLSSQAKNIIQIFENESLGFLSEQQDKK